MEQLVENSSGNLAITNLSRPVKRSHPDSKETQLLKAQARAKYGRGRPIRINEIKDKKLKSSLQRIESKYQDAILSAQQIDDVLLETPHGILQPETDLERTYKTTQQDITSAVSVQQASKSFSLSLDLGPYTANYTRNGKNLLLAGAKGHIATCDWRNGRPICELHLNETIRDAKWLHNDQFFAVAQKKHTYIYDAAGVEIHVLRKYVETTHLEFLPYHFLLAGVENSGFLRYTDTSTGQGVAEIPTRKGPPTALAQNPWNAILHVGHQSGVVSLWSPNSTEALVKIQANMGAVRSVAVDRSGRYMVTGGQDSRMKVWDLRALKEVHSYSTRQPATSISISDRGMAAVVTGTGVTVWNDLFKGDKVQSPYLNHQPSEGQKSKPQNVVFCPYDDILGVGHAGGFTSLIVPGAGEPNYDALEVNPYETKTQRRENEVKALLTKLQPETIALDPSFIGSLDVRSAEEKARAKDLDAPSLEEEKLAKLKERNRGRGKNSALRRHLRKKGGKNVIDEKRVKMEQMRVEKAEREKERISGEKMDLGPALSRFVGSKR